MKIYRVNYTNDSIEEKEVSGVVKDRYYYFDEYRKVDTWSYMSSGRWHTSVDEAINERINKLSSDISSYKHLIEHAESQIKLLSNIL